MFDFVRAVVDVGVEASAIVGGKDLQPHAASVHDHNNKTFDEGMKKNGHMGGVGGLINHALHLPGEAVDYAAKIFHGKK